MASDLIPGTCTASPDSVSSIFNTAGTFQLIASIFHGGGQGMELALLVLVAFLVVVLVVLVIVVVQLWKQASTVNIAKQVMAAMAAAMASCSFQMAPRAPVLCNTAPMARRMCCQ